MIDPLVIALVVLAVTGALIGFASGLLGIGGGFIMVPIQYALLTGFGLDHTLSLRIAFGTSLAVVIPTALSSAYGHHRHACVLERPLRAMFLPCMIGGFAGGTIATHLPGRWMALLFGLFVILAVAKMLPAGAREPSGTPAGGTTLAGYALWGLLFGCVSGIFGIGGGIVMVPVMVTYMRFSMHEAIGTSTALMVGSAAAGVASYMVNGWSVAGLPPWSFGYVNLLQWLPLAAASIPMTQLGVHTAHRLPPEMLRIVFIAILALVGLYMIVSGVTG